MEVDNGNYPSMTSGAGGHSLTSLGLFTVLLYSLWFFRVERNSDKKKALTPAI